MSLDIYKLKRIQEDLRASTDIYFEFRRSMQGVTHLIYRLSDCHDFGFNEFDEELDLLDVVLDKVSNKMLKKAVADFSVMDDDVKI